MKTVFFRVLGDEDKAAALSLAIQGAIHGNGNERFEVDPNDLRNVPGSPFAYWISDAVRALFRDLPPFEAAGRTAKIGASTKNNFRYLRLSWEPSQAHVASAARPGDWVPFAKGGPLSPFYSDFELLVKWKDRAREIEAELLAKFPYLGTNAEFVLHRSHPHFRAGITWPLRAARFAPQFLPAGCVFSDRGYGAFVPADEISSCVAVFNSTIFDYLFKVVLGRHGFPEFIVGTLQRLPWVNSSEEFRFSLGRLALRAWSLKRSLDTRTETSHAFILPATLQVEGKTLAFRAAKWGEEIREIEAEVTTIQAEIDEQCFALYGIGEEDRRLITHSFSGSTVAAEPSEREEDGDAEDEVEEGADGDGVALAADLVSWTVGVAFGRFDVRLATDVRKLPDRPEPFDPLPICSPAMLTGDDGLPLVRPPAAYPLSFPDDGILVDDPGHPRDLTAAVRVVFDRVFGPQADAFWQEATALLEPRDYDMRRWLVARFFEHHFRRYSRSHRQAPILWQLSVPSARYSVWCYAQRMTRDSLLVIQNDIVGPKLATEERRLSSLVTQAGQTPSARERAEIAAQQGFVDELRTLADEVRRVAPIWIPDLDDGIVLVMAPLWRLVPTLKAWQKELHAKWGELVAGKYDWAHIAMHLWPERVVPKCAADRSLAIAHGLEDVFWVGEGDRKWAARKTPTRSIEGLVAERASPAVKAALSSLLEAPGPVAGSGRRVRARVTP